MATSTSSKTKKIILKATKEEVVGLGQKKFLTTVDLITSVVNQRPEGGYSVSDMMQRLSILGAVSKYKNAFSENEETWNDVPVAISEEDFKLLKSLVESSTWAILSDFIADFCSSIINTK